MPSYEIYNILAVVIQVAFVFAFGACLGSLVNVLVYRLPLGISVVTPASRCPNCQTVLSWRDNIPVFGWLFLGGKCRYCKTPISAEYPIVEAIVGALWVLIYAVCYLIPYRAQFAGVDWGIFQPEWAASGLAWTWPTFVVIVLLVSALVAMTIVDAKTYTIPLVLTWVPAILGVVGHTAHAAVVQYATHLHALPRVANGWTWTIATPGPTDWRQIGAALGGIAGVAASNLLLAKGLIRRSWADYEAWEASLRTDAPVQSAAIQAAEVASDPPSSSEPANAAESESVAPVTPPSAGDAVGADVEPPVPQASSPATGAPAAPEGQPAPSELWIAYPHARREVLKEVVFLAPIIGLALAGAGAAVRYAAPWGWDSLHLAQTPARLAPLWLDALSGALLGYLIGGGLVWIVRILGSLAFGKEAMGLGDVHLLAAVGACLGWIDAVFTFFVGAFVALAWAIVANIVGGRLKRAMPFGPALGVAAVLVFLLKPLLERFLAAITHADLPVPLP